MTAPATITHATTPNPPIPSELDTLAEGAATLGFEIVEIAGTLDAIDEDSRQQLHSLDALKRGAGQVADSNRSVEEAAAQVRDRALQSKETLSELVDEIRRNGPASQQLSEWVATLEQRIEDVTNMLAEVRKSNEIVTSIAGQVNILAINAKIEAARAGDAGRGFAVVAEEVNLLSNRTSAAAQRISGQVNNLATWIDRLTVETHSNLDVANQVHAGASRTETAVGNVQTSIDQTHQDATRITDFARTVRESSAGFAPAFAMIGEGAADNATRIKQTRERLNDLVGISEKMVQDTVSIGGVSKDAPFIERVSADAKALGHLLEQAIAGGEITEAELFSRDYRPIPGTDPVQLLAPCTSITDRHFPSVQEAAVEFDNRVIFCAAVDTNGYLPTHIAKFSQKQRKDPVWNAANSRNRRIFDDRVGLKAGRNTEPFLLQVYRRDMGGGSFRMMKDLSAPIFVNGRHWGGLRLAYTL